jgi:hypothetical protein
MNQISVSSIISKVPIVAIVRRPKLPGFARPRWAQSFHRRKCNSQEVKIKSMRAAWMPIAGRIPGGRQSLGAAVNKGIHCLGLGWAKRQ